MNKNPSTRFNLNGAAIGLGTGVALWAALGPAIGIPLGIGLMVVFALTPPRKC